MYDVIVVGTRVAGAATAMLLARRGLRVLAVDRASFPSDTLSTHQLQVPGVARLQRWGLLDEIVTAGTPATRHATFHSAGVAIRGRMPNVEGVDALYSPRRTLLDHVLVRAAERAGAELRSRFVVNQLLFDGDRVAGIAGRSKGGAAIEERAPLVIGADGKNSLVASAVRASTRLERASMTAPSYTYWEGVDLAGGEVHAFGGVAAGAWPTKDGLTMTSVAPPPAGLSSSPDQRLASTLKMLDRCGELGERVRAGRQAERLRSTTDVPNRIRQAMGAGWVLVGDARAVIDPISAQGMTQALRDAELVSDTIVAGLGGSRPLEHALVSYERRRNAELMPMFKFTVGLARLRAPQAFDRALFEAIAGSQAHADRFMAVLSGTLSPEALFNPLSLIQILGLGRLARLLSANRRAAVPARQPEVR